MIKFNFRPSSRFHTVMTTMVALLLMPIFSLRAQESVTGPAATPRLVIIGSSLAAGWVTSWKEYHDLKNGFAQRLARHLEEKGIEVIIAAEPGDTTRDAIKRLDRDLLSLQPDMALIVLSLGNEGLAENAIGAVENYKKGLLEIIDRLKKARIRPILGSCYASNLYSPQQYRVVQETNLWMNCLGLPLINFLGGLDNGSGHIPADLAYDHSHPLNRGHEELFYAISPSLFSTKAGTTELPIDLPTLGVIMPPKGLAKPLISYIPGDIIHSFALSFSFKHRQDTPLAQIGGQDREPALAIVENRLVYRTGGQTVDSESVEPNAWHTVILSHRHLPGTTYLYLDGTCLGTVRETLTPRQFLLGPKGARAVSLRNLLIWRAALSELECRQISQGRLYRGSLEVFAPLGEPLRAKQRVKNLVSDEAVLFSQVRHLKPDLLALEQKIQAGEEQRKAEPVFPERTIIPIPVSERDRYLGEYEIKPGDRVSIDWSEGSFWIIDQGRKQDIHPETPERFFIKQPIYEINVLFSELVNGHFKRLNMTINGQNRLQASWVDPMDTPPKKPVKQKKKTRKPSKK